MNLSNSGMREGKVQERRWRRFPREISGLTRDVSSGGMYFFAEREIGEGSHLEITLHSLNCSGRVVRVEKQPNSQRFGIAVTFEEVHVVPLQSLEGPQLAV
jgi:PilZ domain-containing protein